MASAPPSIDVGEEVLCPICKDCLTDPVTLDCGHNFCRGCITKHCEVRDEISMGDPMCPVCKVKIRKRSFCRNWQLANVAERIKLQEKELCEKHKERLHLFCKEDGELVCLVCQQSPEHEGHTVVLKDKAAQEYKTLICGRLEHLKKEREIILDFEANIGRESDNLLKSTETERQNTVERFRQLHQLLEEQEKRLLNEIEEMEKEIARRRDEHLARLSKEHSFLERSIREMEEKIQQPDSELLWDVKSTLQRCEQKESFWSPWALLQDLKMRISEFTVANPILYVKMEKIKDKLLFRQLQKDVLPFAQPQKANITLDPDTAHRSLILSEDRKCVKWEAKKQNLPDNPERFRYDCCVLGREGFTAGRHFWEVAVGSGESWAVGVARKSVRRKVYSRRLGRGLLSVISSMYHLNYEVGIWAVGKWNDEYVDFFSPHYSPLSLSEEPRRIRVTLDYEEGRVSFSDATSGAELYTFLGATFFGETLFPLFHLWGNETHLMISC